MDYEAKLAKKNARADAAFTVLAFVVGVALLAALLTLANWLDTEWLHWSSE